MAHKTFTILHTNDVHSNLIGVGPSSEYTPETLGDDQTVGGIERIAALIAGRRAARAGDGPVLVLDCGDFSVGTPFEGAMQELSAELQCLAISGYDATTFGNHEFDFGPAALGAAVSAAHHAGHVPTILVGNTQFGAADASLKALQDLAAIGVIRSHMVLERGGTRFGLFGMMGRDSIQFTVNPGALTFDDPIETAKKMVKKLQSEGAEIIICLSHGGVREPKNGPIVEGDDVDLARAVPEIDVIVGGHTHTFMRTPVIVNGTPIVQAGCYGRVLGELVIDLDGRTKSVASYTLHPVDDSILGDVKLRTQMRRLKAETSRLVLEPRGSKIDDPIVIIERDWPNTCSDLEASRPLGNVTADALRYATDADVALSAAGMVRAGLTKGAFGVQTAYDVFLIAPIGIGVKDQSAGGSLVKAYFTGRELKTCLELLLPGNPNLPGQYFPRVSGMRFRYDMSRPKLDAVTEIELGNRADGYRSIDISEASKKLYSLTCNLYLGIILVAMSKKYGVPLSAKKKDGTPMTSRAEALPEHQSGPYLLPPAGSLDEEQVVRGEGAGQSMEIKEWQAIIDYLKSLPTKNERGVSILAMDESTEEKRAFDVGRPS